MSTAIAKEAGFSIHLENNYASGKSKRPRGPRSSLVVLLPHFDLQTRALAYYLQYHLQASIDGPSVCGGVSTCVTSWHRAGRSCPMVDQALFSIALATYSRMHHCPLAASEASSRYYHLLRLAQSCVGGWKNSKYDARDIDAILVATCVMGRYETVTYVHPKSKPKIPIASARSWSHHDGAMAFLKLWDPHLDQMPATFVMKHIRRELVKTYVLRSLALPKWIQNGARFGERGFELEFDQILVRAINLHHAFLLFQQTTNPCVSEWQRLLNEARQLDMAVVKWMARLPKKWSHQQHTLSKPGPFPQVHFYSSAVYSFSQPEHAAIFSEYLATRMIVRNIELRVLESASLFQQSPTMALESDCVACRTDLSEMADSLASTVPYALERIRIRDPNSLETASSVITNTNNDFKPYLANSIVWPLSVACGLQCLSDKQHTWYKEELAAIGRMIGDGLLESANIAEWPTF